MDNSKAKKKAYKVTWQRRFALESQNRRCDELKNRVAVVTGAGREITGQLMEYKFGGGSSGPTAGSHFIPDMAKRAGV